jgi:hypothetical protein
MEMSVLVSEPAAERRAPPRTRPEKALHIASLRSGQLEPQPRLPYLEHRLVRLASPRLALLRLASSCLVSHFLLPHSLGPSIICMSLSAYLGE